MLHHLIQLAIFLGVYLVLRAALLLVPVLVRRMRRFRARRRAATGHWSLALLVYLDEDTGLIHPSVQIHGNRLPKRAKLGLLVVDPLGKTRYSAAQRVPPSAGGREVDLAGFRSPGVLVLAEPMRWRWNVTLRAGRRRLAECSETLSEAGGFNNEAEIVID